MSKHNNALHVFGNVSTYLAATKSMLHLLLMRKDLDEPTRLSMIGLAEHCDALELFMARMPDPLLARMPELFGFWEECCQRERTGPAREKLFLGMLRHAMLRWDSSIKQPA